MASWVRSGAAGLVRWLPVSVGCVDCRAADWVGWPVAKVQVELVARGVGLVRELSRRRARVALACAVGLLGSRVSRG